MKYLYIGCGILAVLLAVCIFCGIFSARGIQESIDPLKAAVSLHDEGDFNAAVKKAAQAKRAWDRHAGFLSSIFSHEELDEIAVAFSDRQSYAATQTQEEFRCRCEELLLRLEHITEMDIPFYYNFLMACI